MQFQCLYQRLQMAHNQKIMQLYFKGSLAYSTVINTSIVNNLLIHKEIL
jgi:hypothetical protein